MSIITISNSLYNILFLICLAIYLSGEIKNLDIFIRNGKFGADISKVQTLLGGVNFIGQTFHIDSIVHTSDIPFHYINGYSLKESSKLQKTKLHTEIFQSFHQEYYYL